MIGVAAAGSGKGGFSASDSSSTSSGGTFMPTFGAVGVPGGNAQMYAVIGLTVIAAAIIWKAVKR